MKRRKYIVVFDAAAQGEALEAADYIARAAPLNARRWYIGLETTIKSLEALPKRFAIAPESEFLYGT